MNQNFAPAPGALSTPILPPCCSTIDLQIANPRPAPPSFLESSMLTCWERSKIFRMKFGRKSRAVVAYLDPQHRYRTWWTVRKRSSLPDKILMAFERRFAPVTCTEPLRYRHFGTGIQMGSKVIVIPTLLRPAGQQSSLHLQCSACR